MSPLPPFTPTFPQQFILLAKLLYVLALLPKVALADFKSPLLLLSVQAKLLISWAITAAPLSWPRLRAPALLVTAPGAAGS